MGKTKKCNQGFSLIELLIAMAILSIIMVMIVQFMSTSSAAYRKTKKNLNIQTESMQVVEQMSDTLMQAKYVRISVKDQGMYSISDKADASSGNRKRTIEKVATPYFGTATETVDKVNFDLVPDNYGNYAYENNLATSSRNVIVDFNNYNLLDKTKSGNKDQPYPLDTDTDYESGYPVKSVRCLKSGTDYRYIKPEFIYAEYIRKDDTGTNDMVVHTLYYITDMTDSKDNTCSIYVYRYTTTPEDSQSKNYEWARKEILSRLGVSDQKPADKPDADESQFTAKTASIKKADGLLTDKIADFYLTADAEGNSLLTNIMFLDEGYQYNAVESINFRNSDVLTVRPQKLLRKQGTGNP